ncbi:MAG: hypothetical protein HOP29_05135 [Phycisphaerales bacterium]|nr:hypothetical protein [Phycisphaerales bacterium]
MSRSPKSRILVSAFVVVGCGRLLAQHEQGGHKPDHAAPAAALPNCPVTGDEPINLAVRHSTPDGPVFFCCKNCVPKYKADTAKYAAKVGEQRKALAGRSMVQVSCAVCRKTVDPKIGMDQGGVTVLFSSAECMSQYQADPAKYASALADAFTYQTKCPISGDTIDPKSFTATASGGKIYFCCQPCEKKLIAEPSKYLANLAAQGYTLDPKELVKAPSGEQPEPDHDDHH